MNRPIRRISIVLCVFFTILLINSSYSMIARHHYYYSSDYNIRVRTEEFARNRGAIMVGNTAIADTVPSNDALKFQRTYPGGAMYAPITGFFTRSYGASGLERSYNAELSGTADSMVVNSLIDRFTNKPPTGATIETTLNPKAQKAAYDALTKLNAKGAVVALNPQTGAVLAAVSTPSYDPTGIASHDRKQAEEAWEALNADKNRPAQNRAAREIYPPGSTFKVVVTAAALENGMKSDSLVDAPDRLILPGTNTALPNQGECGNKKITLDDALRQSCNTAFANVGMQLGEDKIAAQAAKFGFGQPHLEELGGVASKYPTGMNKAELAQSSIGQFDVTSTPLQMAMVAAAVANNGKVMDPYLVETVRAPDLAVISKHQSKQLGTAMSEANAKQLQTMMFHVIDNGSGSKAKVSGVQLGGKTGTAETVPGVPPYGWFIMFGPGNNPSFALAVCITESNAPAGDKGYAGASIAAPVAKQVAEALLK